MKITMKKILVSLSLLFAGVSLSSCGFPGLTVALNRQLKLSHNQRRNLKLLDQCYNN